MEEPTCGADANRDGKINSLDVTKTQRIIIGLDSSSGLHVALITSFSQPIAAQDTVISMKAPTNAFLGEVFNVRVNITNVTDLNAADFKIDFNPNVLNVTGVVEGKINGSKVPLVWNKLDRNTLVVSCKLPGLEGATGSGYLSLITFKAVNAGESTLDIYEGTLSNTNAEEISALLEDCKVTIMNEEKL